MCVIQKKETTTSREKTRRRRRIPSLNESVIINVKVVKGLIQKAAIGDCWELGGKVLFFFYFPFSQLVTDMSTHGPVVCCVSVMPAIVIWPSAQWDERVFSSCFYFFFCILKNDDIFVDVVVDFTFFIDLLALLQFKKERNIPASGRFNTLAV